jgi:hypothetical protein
MSLLAPASTLSPLQKDRKVIINKTAGLLRYIKGSELKLPHQDFTTLLDTVWELYEELGDSLEELEKDHIARSSMNGGQRG